MSENQSNFMLDDMIIGEKTKDAEKSLKLISNDLATFKSIYKKAINTIQESNMLDMVPEYSFDDYSEQITKYRDKNNRFRGGDSTSPYAFGEHKNYGQGILGQYYNNVDKNFCEKREKTLLRLQSQNISDETTTNNLSGRRSTMNKWEYSNSNASGNINIDDIFKNREISEILSAQYEECKDKYADYEGPKDYGNFVNALINGANGNIDNYGIYDALTEINNLATKVNKSAFVVNTIANFKNIISSFSGVKNALEGFFLPTTSVIFDRYGSLIKGFGEIGDKAGIVSTVLTPILEFENSKKPYEDDIEYVKEYDPENATFYENACNFGAACDAASFGYVRSVANTIPSVAQLLGVAGKDADGEKSNDWSNVWINTVNEYVNIRSLREKAEDFYNEPVNNFFIKYGVQVGIRYELERFGFYK